MVINLDWQSWSRPQLTLKSSSDSVRNPLQIWPYRFMEVMKCLRKQNQKSESALFLTTHFHPWLISRNFTQPMTPFTGTHGCISLHIHVSSPSPSPWMLLILWWKCPNQQLPKVSKELRFNTTLRTRRWERLLEHEFYSLPLRSRTWEKPPDELLKFLLFSHEMPLWPRVAGWFSKLRRLTGINLTLEELQSRAWHDMHMSICISPRKYGTLVVVALLETLSLLWFADRSGPSLLVSKGATIPIEVWIAWPPIGSLSSLWGQLMVLCQKSNFVNRCRHLFSFLSTYYIHQFEDSWKSLHLDTTILCLPGWPFAEGASWQTVLTECHVNFTRVPSIYVYILLLHHVPGAWKGVTCSWQALGTVNAAFVSQQMMLFHVCATANAKTKVRDRDVSNLYIAEKINLNINNP